MEYWVRKDPSSHNSIIPKFPGYCNLSPEGQKDYLLHARRDPGIFPEFHRLIFDSPLFIGKKRVLGIIIKLVF